MRLPVIPGLWAGVLLAWVDFCSPEKVFWSPRVADGVFFNTYLLSKVFSDWLAVSGLRDLKF